MVLTPIDENLIDSVLEYLAEKHPEKVDFGPIKNKFSPIDPEFLKDHLDELYNRALIGFKEADSSAGRGYVLIKLTQEGKCYMRSKKIINQKESLRKDINIADGRKDIIPVVIDGPNLISRIIGLNIKNQFIAAQFSAVGLRKYLYYKLSSILDYRSPSGPVEFVCSRKHMGPEKKKLSRKEQDLLLKRLMNESDVYVDQVSIPGSSDKAVDATVLLKINKFAKEHSVIFLVSEDRDYIPILKELRHKTKVITLAIRDKFPKELKNESFATFEVGDDYLWFFTYSYPSFKLDGFSIEQCEELYSNADDRVLNRVSISSSGYVFIAAGDMLKQDYKCTFETLISYNGYVGPLAASDDHYIAQEHRNIIKAWELGLEGFIDYNL